MKLPPIKPPSELDLYARRRLTMGAVLLGAGIVAIVVALLSSGSGGSPADPRALVPASATLYAEADLSQDGDAGQAADTFASRVPLLSHQILARLTAGYPSLSAAGVVGGGGRVPWLGNILALAQTPEGSLALLAAGDSDGAAKFAQSYLHPRSTARVAGVDVMRGKHGSAAIVDGFLAIGDDAAVRMSVELAGGDGAGALSSEKVATDTLASLPDSSLVRAFVAGRGLRALGPLSALGESNPVGLAASFTPQSIELTAHVGFDGKSSPALAGLKAFKPRLPEDLDSGTLGYVGIGPPTTLEQGLLGQAGSSLPATAALLLGQLGIADPGGLLRALAPALGDETAIAVIPGPGAEGSDVVAPPSLGLASDRVDEETALKALHSLGSDVTGSVSGSRLYVAGTPSALARLSNPQGSLASSGRFREALGGLALKPSFEAYLDVAGLLPIFEAAGLAENPAYASFASDARRLDALGLTLTSSSAGLDVRVRLTLTGI